MHAPQTALGPRLWITPEDALIDVDRTMLIDGFAPHTFVTVTARMTLCGVPWQSSAVFLTGHDGRLDLRRDGPVSGSYDRPSAMGLVWSMTCASLDQVVYPPDRTDAITVDVQATDGQHSCTGQFVQRFIAPGVTHRAIRETVNGQAIVGELFTPPGPGPFPVVIYLNGSSGGLSAPRAALFAAHGYQSLALAVFNVEGRPRYLNDMPLEYFEAALSWIHATLKPAGGFVAVSGISRGGEMSLLIASHFPEQVSAVVAYVPSPVTHGVVSAGAPGTGRDAQVWTWQGKPLPHLWQDNAHADWDAAYATQPPYRQTRAFLTAVADRAAFERARIPVERFPGPVLLVSASDDGFWPSTAFSEIVQRRREDHNPPRPTWHHVCAGAGHHVHYPGLPTTLIAKPHAMSGLLLDAGGSPAANAEGNAGSYKAVLEFLARSRQG